MNVPSNPSLPDENCKPGVETKPANAPLDLDDPVIDTPVIVTLDQLKPYDLNPRVTRNPKYEEIKASIRQRGLDAPPSITRRPGETHYRVRNGGNTRLAILRELWSETKDDQFFHLSCLFRPWPKRGEIIALTGHLAENELRGGLTFIERALGVEKARSLYESESGAVLSQSELSRRLTADGYPVHQSHISRMRDAVEHLLPAIPNLLYGGLGRHQVERLAVMRRSLASIWSQLSKGKAVEIDFPSLFHESLVIFDGPLADFSIARVQDEMVGQMAHCLGVDYETLFLIVDSGERRELALTTPSPGGASPQLLPDVSVAQQSPETPIAATSMNAVSQSTETPSQPMLATANVEQRSEDLADEHIGGQSAHSNDVLPFTQGSLFPIKDIWNIEPNLDEPQRLRTHISQFAREICQDVANADLITEVNEGLGFQCCPGVDAEPSSPSSFEGLLTTLSTGAASVTGPVGIGSLLLGSPESAAQTARLSDASLVKLFRLIRLARRLIDLQEHDHPSAALSQKEPL